MTRASGTIESRGRDRWRVRVYLGTDAAGKRHYLSQNVEGTAKDADKVRRSMLARKDQGGLRPRSGLTVERYLAQWLDVNVRPRVRPRTLEFYQQMSDRYIKPAIGWQRLDKLHTLDVQRWTNSLHDRGLAPRTVRAAFATLHAALRQAVRLRILSHDPSDLVELPRQRRVREVKVLDPAGAIAFLEACSTDPLGSFFVVQLATGCRPGEVAALRWSDVDLDRASVAVRQALSRTAQGVEFLEPKTDRGRRVIPLPAFAVAALRQHRVKQLEARMAAGGAWRNPELVFTETTGAPVDLANLRKRNLRRIARRARPPVEHFAECTECKPEGWYLGLGLCEKGKALQAEAESLTLYALRHTAASLLLAGGVNVKVVSERLGHASTGFTMDTYVHSLPTMQEQAAATLEGMLAPAKASAR